MKGKPMNAKSKKTLKAAAMGAGLVAVLLPTGCGNSTGPGPIPAAQPPAAPDTVVAPPAVD
jgi:hypothetical protein